MWHFLFSLRGRVARASFCLFAAIAFGVLLALFAALYARNIMTGNYENGGPVPWPSTPPGIAGAALWFGILLLLCVSGLCVTLKRLHDRDRPSWWLLVFVVLPNALSSCGQMLRDRVPNEGVEIGLGFDILALAVFAWAFVELACLKGTAGDNRFGPDPLVRRA
ncbi:MAG TPA: DUF805 domain-containing protein [Rhizomicrobium sp.]|nr:DUF805 domain-containing protein [Rhizomicrobium sp.]